MCVNQLHSQERIKNTVLSKNNNKRNSSEEREKKNSDQQTSHCKPFQLNVDISNPKSAN